MADASDVRTSPFLLAPRDDRRLRLAETSAFGLDVYGKSWCAAHYARFAREPPPRLSFFETTLVLADSFFLEADFFFVPVAFGAAAGAGAGGLARARRRFGAGAAFSGDGGTPYARHHRWRWIRPLLLGATSV